MMFIFPFIHSFKVFPFAFITFVLISAQEEEHDYQSLIRAYGGEEILSSLGMLNQGNKIDLNTVSFDVNLTNMDCTLNLLFMPIPLTSMPYKSEEVHYLLYTKNNIGNTEQKNIILNDIRTIGKNFNEIKKTYFIFHGFNSSGLEEWILEIKTKILNIEDVNVIVVNYESLVKGPPMNYGNAACNLYKIANHTAYFISWLNKLKKINTNNVHLIGHSLGAHLAGMVGQFLTKNFQSLKIARITGLDPSGPFFKSIKKSKRLDKSNAEFVDVIHSNGCPEVTKCLGLAEESGHIDFYPNGGVLQTGCKKTNLSCNHLRAVHYFTESIVSLPTNVKVFKAWKCSSWKDYISGACPKTCTPTTCLDMGFNLQNSGLDGENFYLSTNANPPYAKGE